MLMMNFNTVPQDLPYQAEACASTKAEQTHSPMDSIEDWQHHQVRLQYSTTSISPDLTRASAQNENGIFKQNSNITTDIMPRGDIGVRLASVSEQLSTSRSEPHKFLHHRFSVHFRLHTYFSTITNCSLAGKDGNFMMK